MQSIRMEEYAYRVYDANAIARLRQIIVLRRLRVPIKQIVSILNNADAVEIVEIFQQNISQLDREITALSTVKSILQRFVAELSEKAAVNLNLLGDDTLFSMIGTLSFPNNHIQEKKEDLSMDELNTANTTLDQITDRDVRILYLPPMCIAAYCAQGENCEEKANDAISRFVTQSNLTTIKPDLRSFGFDCSQGQVNVGQPSRAYEVWVSIPEDLPVPPPLVKRTFRGGMYAAHVLRAWDFQDWRLLKEWVDASGKYESAWGDSRWSPEETGPGQGFEEHLNYWGNAAQGFKMEDMQLDLLFPIRAKQ